MSLFFDSVIIVRGTPEGGASPRCGWKCVVSAANSNYGDISATSSSLIMWMIDSAAGCSAGLESSVYTLMMARHVYRHRHVVFTLSAAAYGLRQCRSAVYLLYKLVNDNVNNGFLLFRPP